ncbi:MAG: isocitrate/isopropylmalate family dehydrogenase, partial [Bryobacteraceae bacterium]
MKVFHIAVLPGDGAGPEVTREALKVLRAVEQRLDGICLEPVEYPAGAGEYLRTGQALPKATLEAARQADAVLLGAMGLPEVRLPG